MPEGFIARVLKSTEQTESPEVYQYWSSLAAISAVAKNNVYKDRFIHKLFPNIYVFLIGPSGIKKSGAVSFAREMVSIANNTKVISGRSSIEGLIKELSQGHTLPDGVVLKDATGFMAASEFSSFLIHNPEALTILTDLFDAQYNKEWKNTLKSTGVETLKNVCLTLLAASNEENFKAAVPKAAINGGFIGRSLVVRATEERCSNSLMYKPDAFVDATDLSSHLKELSFCKGEFTIVPQAAIFYDSWYNDFKKKKKKIRDLTGTVQRVPDNVLKVSMLLSLSRGTSLEINNNDMIESIEVCVECFAGTKHLALGTGTAALGSQTAKVLDELVMAPDQIITRRRLLSRNWEDFDALDLDRIIETLIQTGALTVSSDNGMVIYKMTAKAYAGYKTFKGED